MFHQQLTRLTLPATSRRRRGRKGAATVEFALTLPFLAFFFVVAVDFARVFRFATVASNCARNGALYACDPNAAELLPYNSVEEAALADASDLPTPPVVHVTQGEDAVSLPYVEVTVEYPFQTITKFPGIPHEYRIIRKARMRAVPPDEAD